MGLLVHKFVHTHEFSTLCHCVGIGGDYALKSYVRNVTQYYVPERPCVYVA